MLLKMWCNLWKLLFNAAINLVKYMIGEIGELISNGLKAAVDKIKEKFPTLSNLLTGIATGATPGGAPGAVPTVFPGARVPEMIAAGTGGPATTVAKNELNLKTEIMMQIPETTPENQRQYLEVQARDIVSEELNKAVNQAIVSNPVVE
jgi:hypothetical protein